MKDSKAMHEMNRHSEQNAGISMTDFDSLDDYTEALMARASTEGLHEMTKKIEYAPMLEMVKNELKKRGELS